MHTQAVILSTAELRSQQEMFYYFCHILPIYPGFSSNRNSSRGIGFFMVMRKTLCSSHVLHSKIVK